MYYQNYSTRKDIFYGVASHVGATIDHSLTYSTCTCKLFGGPRISLSSSMTTSSLRLYAIYAQSERGSSNTINHIINDYEFQNNGRYFLNEKWSQQPRRMRATFVLKGKKAFYYKVFPTFILSVIPWNDFGYYYYYLFVLIVDFFYIAATVLLYTV